MNKLRLLTGFLVISLALTLAPALSTQGADSSSRPTPTAIGPTSTPAPPEYYVYLADLKRGQGRPTPTPAPPGPTATPSPTPTSTPTNIPTSTPIPTPTPGTVLLPTSTPTPDPRGVFALNNAFYYKGSSSISEDAYYIVGEIQNDTRVYVKDIQYVATLHEAGRPDRSFSGTLYWTIPPRGKACFKYYIGGLSGGPYTVTTQVVAYVEGSGSRIPNTRYSDVSARRVFGGEVLWVDFVLTNDEPSYILNAIYQAALYDSAQTLIGCRVPANGWPGRFDLASEDSKSLKASFSALHFTDNILSMRVQTNADVVPAFTPSPTPTATPTLIITLEAEVP